jgi:hypothetical protein
MFDFTKIHSEPINRDFILSKISDSQIFYQYFGKFEIGKVYSSKFRKDKNPSTGFYVNKTGRLIYNDISTSEKLDCFAFVAKLFNISYSEAIKKVAVDFGIIDGVSTTIINPETYTSGLQIDTDCKKKTIIQFKPDSWKEEYLTYWREFEITKDELISEGVYPIKDLYINKKKIYNKDNHLRFAYVEKYKGEEFVKIYSPHDPQMKWVSNIPLNVPFGLSDLKFKSDTVIITKSKKDLMVLKKIFTDVIATQNESESSLSNEVQELLLNNFSKAYIFWDNDPTGVDNCKKFNARGFRYFNIPREYYEKFKIKDASDYIAFYGVDALKELFEIKHIL